MILAAILRNFKCHKGINIIPLCRESLDYMSIIIGNNGVGKSAVLEGLNTLFNNASWIVNNEIRGKKEEVYVWAVMMVEKSRAATILDGREIQIMEEVSNFFWDVEETNPTLRQYAKFFELRNAFVAHKNDNYLFVAGREMERNENPFLTFTSLLRGALTVDTKPDNHTLSKLIEKILSLYTYIYVPVEASISEFVKLQNQSLQTLMDSSVRESISQELTNKRITRTKDNGKKIKLSLLEMINEFLEKYIQGVEYDIQSVYPGYSYQPAPRQSSRLTPNHVVDTIVSAYYSKRSFKKDGKEIQYLSSGEKRLILIDIISAFVKKRNAAHELIIAVDEPENSLHVSKCYDQFKKIEEIALKYNHQLFVTTHWYGSLPCLNKGNLVYIDNHGKPSVYGIANYYEDRGELPEDVYLKGFFDLSSSLMYAFRESGKHWLLVEGFEDKKYFNYHLGRNDIRIIPMGGCGNVRKIYEYLFIPCSSKEFSRFTKRMVCVIDTDAQCPTIGLKCGDNNDILKIRRLQQLPNGDVDLVEVNAPERHETEVEEILNAKQFYDALTEAINQYGEDEDKAAFETFEFDNTAKNSRIKGDDSILKVKDITRNAREDKQRIMTFVDEHKDAIADIYTQSPYTGVAPSWVAKLNALLQ